MPRIAPGFVATSKFGNSFKGQVNRKYDTEEFNIGSVNQMLKDGYAVADVA